MGITGATMLIPLIIKPDDRKVCLTVVVSALEQLTAQIIKQVINEGLRKLNSNL